jgi:Protein of unknown function (DUF4230)
VEGAEEEAGLESASRGARLIAGTVAAAVVIACTAGAFVLGRAQAPASADRIAIRPTSEVVLAVRDLSRLESATFHMEKIVELTDEQSRLFGLVQAKDQILLVAVGDVVAGVDLAKLGDADVEVRPAGGGVRIVLPAPEVLTTAIDEAETHVYGRTTDLLAARKNELESLARKEASARIEEGARNGGILERARASAERTVRALLQSLGFREVVVEWKSPAGERR